MAISLLFRPYNPYANWSISRFHGRSRVLAQAEWGRIEVIDLLQVAQP
ncbi:MAG: hypothetical protein ACRD1O_05945 [Terriglobia bacterium]